MNYIFTFHAENNMKIRNISEEWVILTINNPEFFMYDNNRVGYIFFFKKLKEANNKMLKVICFFESKNEIRIITTHFDRRYGVKFGNKI